MSPDRQGREKGSEKRDIAYRLVDWEGVSLHWDEGRDRWMR